MTGLPSFCVTVLAHNEAARIARCLNSLPLADPNVVVHVVVNGSSDQTAAIAREIGQGAAALFVHEYVTGGKARSWNRFVLDELPDFHDVHIFADGDAEIAAGSVYALADTLRSHPAANAAAGLPLNGRRAAHYQAAIREESGMFGDLYALRGDFLRRMKQAQIRLPDDLIGDDGLIAALAKTDLQNERNYDPARLVACDGAGFECDPVTMWQPASWRLQYRRMVNYSVRYYQNAMISQIMKGAGPQALPRNLSSLYGAALPVMRPRARWPEAWFDRQALKRLAS